MPGLPLRTGGSLIKQGSGIAQPGRCQYLCRPRVPLAVAGTLEIGDINNPNASIAGNVTVGGGTLAGHGSIGGNVFNTTGIVQPGGTVGTLTFAATTPRGSTATLPA